MKRLPIIAIAFVLSGCHAPNCKPQDLVQGMARERVLALCGAPSGINYTGFADSATEQWVYDDRTYLYIENGKLHDMQWED